MCKPIKLSNQIAVIDGTAWFAYGLMALSLNVFRQPSNVLDQGPSSHRWENLPKIFIPNNLTAPEIGRALRTSSKAQILAETNKVGPKDLLEGFWWDHSFGILTKYILHYSSVVP